MPDALRRGRRLRALLAAAVLATAAGVGILSPAALAATPPGGAPYAVPAAGTYYPTEVQRLLGSGAGYPLSADTDVTVPVVGQGALPSAGISAAVVNVTASAGPSGAMFGAGGTPSASQTPMVTVPPDATVSTLLTVPLGTSGSFDLHAVGGPVAVTADLVGFYASDDTIVASRGVSGGYQPADPVRLYDSQPAARRSVFDLSAGPADGPLAAPTAGPVAPTGQTSLRVDLGRGVAAHVVALALRVSAVAPSAAGALTVWGDGARPQLSTVSYATGRPATNLAVVPVQAGPDGGLDVELANSGSAAVDVTVDLVGFYDDGGLGPNLRFRPLTPTRVVDSSSRVGTAALATDTPATLLAPSGVAGDSTVALVGVLTAVSPTSATEVTLWPHGADQPEIVDLQAPAGVTTSVAVQPELDPTNALDLATTTGPTQLRFDVTGSFEAFPPVTNPALKGWVHVLSSWQVSAVAR
ncbi:MAG: hypothetical protein M3Z83_02095 [Actinomycetota bacterium]|nr:hypothetical protein [Actinomycetota bacterium]